MKLLNFSEIKSEFVRTTKNFPLPMFFGAVGAALLIYNAHLEFAAQQAGLYGVWPEYIIPVVFACMFAYLLFLTVDLFSMVHKRAWYKHAGRILAAGVVGVVYLTLFKNFKFWAVNDVMEFAILHLAGVILVLLAPFLRSKVKMQDFWNYLVRTLFNVVFTGVLFGVLFAGIALLFTSIDYLFHTNIEGVYYGDVWFFIVGFLASPFFLANFPRDFKRLKDEGNFLRILSEYFLVPLVMVYFVMLYIYTGKMVLTWQWPDGGVAGWIIGYSMVGIFAYVFSYAIKEKSLRYVELFKKWFFVALIPLTLVLFIALWWRVSAYSITEWRYLGFAFGLWLLGNAIYFIISKAKDLRAFLITLVAVLMVSVYGGPVSAFSVAREYQVQRLVGYMAEAGMIEEDNVTLKKVAEFDRESKANAEVYLLSQYLVDHFGIVVLQERFDGDVDNLVMTGSSMMDDRYSLHQQFLISLGFPQDYYPPVYNNYSYNGEQYVNFIVDSPCYRETMKSVLPYDCPKEVKGWGYYLNFSLPAQGTSLDFVVDGKRYKSSLNGGILSIMNEAGSPLLKVEMAKFLENLKAEPGVQNVVPPERFKVQFMDQYFVGELRVVNVSAIYVDGKYLRPDYIGGDLLLKRR